MEDEGNETMISTTPVNVFSHNDNDEVVFYDALAMVEWLQILNKNYFWSMHATVALQI